MAKVFEIIGVFYVTLAACDITYNAWLGATGRDEPESHSVVYAFSRALAGYSD